LILKKRKDGGGGASTQAATTFAAPKSTASLQSELDAAHKRITELEGKLKAAGIKF